MEMWSSYRTGYTLYVILYLFVLMLTLMVLPRSGCYPFQTHDPFVLQTCPHIFFAGNQPRFATTVVAGDIPLRADGTDAEMVDTTDTTVSPRVRLLAIPEFSQTGELVLVDSETLEVEVAKFGGFEGKEEKR